ncbi:hypothetical protein BFAG_02380 [Bacteroides fragilis 3_1_12]|uniref:Uncharacterized protein n=1 Tax=Bacteroides fragilis 3_1_12 TaxID=457424 RepID=A0ABN0BLG1_BACFG|nr:hypothetical protein BFAG_02380 [Bacteroides fragilis 3_1_12]
MQFTKHQLIIFFITKLTFSNYLQFLYSIFTEKRPLLCKKSHLHCICIAFA